MTKQPPELRKLDAHIGLSRYIGGGEETWRLHALDRASGCMIFNIELTDEQFSSMFGGLREVKVDYWFNDNLGKRREYVRLNVPSLGQDWYKLTEFKRQEVAITYAAAQGYLPQDEWEITDDLSSYNQHYYRHDDGSYEVGFARFVDIDEEA